MFAAGLHGDCTTPWPSVRDAAWRAQDRCRTAHGAPGSATQSCRAPDKTHPVAGTGCVVLSGDLDQLLPCLGIQRQGTDRQADRGLSAWEVDRSRPMRTLSRQLGTPDAAVTGPLITLANWSGKILR
jgi:hypothetical protein